MLFTDFQYSWLSFFPLYVFKRLYTAAVLYNMLVWLFSNVCYQKALHCCAAHCFTTYGQGFTTAIVCRAPGKKMCHCTHVNVCLILAVWQHIPKKGLNPHEDRPILFVFQNSFVTSFSVPILSPGISLLNWGIQINQYVVFGVSNFAFMRVGRLCSCLFSVHVCVFLCAVVQGCSCLFVPGYVQVYVWYTLYIRVWVHMVQ